MHTRNEGLFETLLTSFACSITPEPALVLTNLRLRTLPNKNIRHFEYEGPGRDQVVLASGKHCDVTKAFREFALHLGLDISRLVGEIDEPFPDRSSGKLCDSLFVGGRGKGYCRAIRQ